MASSWSEKGTLRYCVNTIYVLEDMQYNCISIVMYKNKQLAPKKQYIAQNLTFVSCLHFNYIVQILFLCYHNFSNANKTI